MHLENCVKLMYMPIAIWRVSGSPGWYSKSLTKLSDFLRVPICVVYNSQNCHFVITLELGGLPHSPGC